MNYLVMDQAKYTEFVLSTQFQEITQHFYAASLSINYAWADDRRRWVYGVGARMRVRAGLDSRYIDCPDKLVQFLLKVPGIPAEVRAELALEAIGGWVTSYPSGVPPVLTWHRLIGATAVVVTRTSPHRIESPS